MSVDSAFVFAAFHFEKAIVTPMFAPAIFQYPMISGIAH